ncbi:MAG: aspartyl/asparaginyl beta-hydroxylase domain-containing protein [Sphingomicrobium sp.]
MRFDTPFIKLPFQFDAEALEREVRALPPSVWVPHPTGFKGNEAVRLITVNGQPTDAFEGPMRPTENLARLPYVQQIMAELDGVWSRSRLMGLGPGAEVPEHVDAHYQWRTHVRIHVPVITDPKVLFTCDDETVHMAPGECWLFDSFRWHRVENGWSERRVHLVLDSVMTPSLRKFVEDAAAGAETRTIAPAANRARSLKFETLNVSPVMSPWEMRCHTEFILDHAVEHPALESIRGRLERFTEAWGAVWAQFGMSMQGLADYRQLLVEARADIAGLAPDDVVLGNSLLVRDVLDSMIFIPALVPSLAAGNVVGSVTAQRLAS